MQREDHLTHQANLCTAAARSGQLEELKVLHQNGTPWNENICAYAAEGGNRELLQ